MESQHNQPHWEISTDTTLSANVSFPTDVLYLVQDSVQVRVVEVSFVLSSLWQLVKFSQSDLSRDLDMFLTLTVLKNSGQLLCRRSSLWVGALLFAHGYDGFSLFGLGSDALYLSLHHTRWYRCQSVLLLVILTSFTWLRWYLPGLSTVKLLSVLQQSITVLQGDPLRLCKCLICHTVLPITLACIGGFYL